MGVTNFWPPTADIYFEGEFLTKARLVGSAYEANYPRHVRTKLLTLQYGQRLIRGEASKRTERRTENGELIGIDISDVRFDLSAVPSDH